MHFLLIGSHFYATHIEIDFFVYNFHRSSRISTRIANFGISSFLIRRQVNTSKYFNDRFSFIRNFKCISSVNEALFEYFSPSNIFRSSVSRLSKCKYYCVNFLRNKSEITNDRIVIYSKN